jgi:glycine/D-amino acid oxidase-like deaminating enzyme
VENYGADAARSAYTRLARSVAEIGAFARAQGFDCEYEHNGFLSIASGVGQRRRVEMELEVAARLGLSGFAFLDREEIQSEIHSELFACGLLDETCALIQPAKLAVGIKQAVLRAGVQIFESTPVSRLALGRVQRMDTPRGTVTAEEVVLSTNAWTSLSATLGRRQVPLFSYILLSRPLTESQHAKIGWRLRQGASDMRNYLHYFRMTRDNRIMWGGEARYFFGRNVDERHETNRAALATVEKGFRRVFPQLHDLEFEHRWSGPISLTVRFVPTFGRLPGTGLCYGFGYSGHGIAASHTGGQILRDLVLSRTSDLTNLLVTARGELTSPFPPEPAAYLGIHLSRWALKRQDRRMELGLDGDREPSLTRVMQRASSLLRRARRRGT